MDIGYYSQTSDITWLDAEGSLNETFRLVHQLNLDFAACSSGAINDFMSDHFSE